jgi:hypothetical protein
MNELIVSLFFLFFYILFLSRFFFYFEIGGSRSAVAENSGLADLQTLVDVSKHRSAYFFRCKQCKKCVLYLEVVAF